MRTRLRYDADLDAMVEIRDGNYFVEATTSVISDDMGAGVNGLRGMFDGRMYDSKSRIRAEAKARGLGEVGTEKNFASKKEMPTTNDYRQAVYEAHQQFVGNWNGARDRMSRK